jgi:hypothetical protein
MVADDRIDGHPFAEFIKRDRDHQAVLPVAPLVLPREQPSPLTHARVVVLDTTYHQAAGGSPTAVDHKWSRWLETDEQPYQRRMQVQQEWIPLDYGWLTNVGLVMMQNVGRKFHVKPTDAEKALAARDVVEIGAAIPSSHEFDEVPSINPLFCIRPGESFRAEPVAGSKLYVRSSSGAPATLLVFALPR